MTAEKRVQNWILVAVVFILAVAVPLWKVHRDEPPVKQGIDLVGGVDLLLQARPPEGEEKVTQDMLMGAIDIVRNRLDPEGIKEIIIQQMGEDRIVIQIPGEDDPERVKRMIGATATLRFIDAGNNPLGQGTHLRYIDKETGEPISQPGLELAEEAVQPSVIWTDQVLYQGEDLLGFRVLTEEEELEGEESEEAEGATEPADEPKGEIVLELNQETGKGVQLAVHTTQHQGEYLVLLVDEAVRSVVEITHALTKSYIPFPDLADDPRFDPDQINAALDTVAVAAIVEDPPAVGEVLQILDPLAAGRPEEVERVDVTTDQIVLTGDDFANAAVTFDPRGRPIIAFEFKSEGRDIFARFTAKHVGQYLAIALDDVIISCPVIREGIFGGRGVIEGNFQIAEAEELVVKLNSGRLPVPLEIIENRTVGPTLGVKSIDDSKRAAILGAILILLFMFLYYRLPGMLADFALIFYGVVFMGALSILNATLTLPGIAGFILSVGMAVDANIIIFERLKEELRTGKTFRSAVDAAFKRAFLAIFDANVTTLITAIVLYNLGTGPIRGFAVTLSLGILVSMFSALVFTRLLLEGALSYKRLQRHSLFGVRESEIAAGARGGEAR